MPGQYTLGRSIPSEKSLSQAFIETSLVEAVRG
jgi:hypothetical protein